MVRAEEPDKTAEQKRLLVREKNLDGMNYSFILAGGPSPDRDIQVVDDDLIVKVGGNVVFSDEDGYATTDSSENVEYRGEPIRFKASPPFTLHITAINTVAHGRIGSLYLYSEGQYRLLTAGANISSAESNANCGAGKHYEYCYDVFFDKEYLVEFSSPLVPPEAAFTFSPNEPEANQEVTLNACDSKDEDGAIDSYSWDLNGDGHYEISTESCKTRYTYETSGDYNITSKVTDEDGQSDKTEELITVFPSNEKPRVSFSFRPSKPTVTDTVNFHAEASDPDGTITEYKWDLTGDGDLDKTGSEVTHIFGEEGTYEVKLTITDDNGATASTTKQITVAKKEESQQETKIGEKYGLVIGISKYKNDLIRHLSYSKEDAEAFYRFLTKDGSFSKDKVTLLVNDEAATGNISKAFSNLVTKTSKDDLVLIYYSGHGTYGPDYNNDEEDGHDEYYVTYDTDTSDGDSLYHTGISDDQFGNWINSLQSDKVTIVLDSCYSGGATKSAKTINLPTHTGKAGPTNTVFNDFSFEDRLLFAASGENQQSFEAPPSADFNHGVFTHFMLKGLKGAADKDNDGNITAEEVYSYVKPKVQNYVSNTFSSYQQTPLMKGVSTIPLVTGEEKLTGKVKYVKGEDNTKASKDEFVVINLGSKDGVRTGDKFKVFFTDEEAGAFREINGTLEIREIIGSHLALGKVMQAGYMIKKGDRVEKVKK